MNWPEWVSDDGRVRLINADCLDVLPTLTGIDAVVTDPPYGVGFKYESHDDSEEGYADWLWGILEQAEGKCCGGAPLAVWQAAKHIGQFGRWFPRKFRVLIAAKSFAQVLPGPTWPSYEPVVIWWKDGGKAEAYGSCRRDFCIADTTPSGRERRHEKLTGHPCPRPIHHAVWVVENWTPPSGLVLDPFGGAATTAAACIRTDRRCICIEKEPKYFQIGVQRCRDEYNRTALFNAQEARS